LPHFENYYYTGSPYRLFPLLKKYQGQK